MANKSFLTNFEFSRFQEKRFIPLYTQRYAWICLFQFVTILLYGKKSDSSYFTTNVVKVSGMAKEIAMNFHGIIKKGTFHNVPFP